ncbi:uncharacterized protein LOC125770669 [Anopheles funestus]|uniref:uncharacterized protein LOC125770669 n=1 Tax=Anopheles funestus TaxID=62324 RepID=UPI0020C684E4|nr:uncharacterized protein LOC125770669 [Anopheles funestus]
MYGSVWNLLNNFLHNPLTFYVDTAHLHWNTTFPAVSLCQIVNGESVAELTEHFTPVCTYYFLSFCFILAHQLYRYYSFSACSIECFWKTQLEICNCTHHLMPQTLTTTEYETQICSFEGLTCLTENSVDIARARKQCPCLSSCVEPEHFVVHKSDE